MSLALYRKYRPGTFAEVKGQEHVTEPLRQALRSGRINHAYLFSGPRGCGKTSSARILARSLNCEKGPTPDPCGECESCVALAPTGPGHLDVIEIDAASHGGVDDARDLRERAFFAPVSSRFKIYIIDEAHMVTREGFNALLKLVEEPPPHLKFVFATTEPEKVIGTIKSRTHHYPFRLIPPAALRTLMEEILTSENVPFEPAALPLVVRAGAGSARDSLSILDQLFAGSDEAGITYARAVSLLGYTDGDLIDEMVSAFAGRDGARVFEAVNRVVEGGHDPRRFAMDLLERFRDLVILANVPEAATSGLLDRPGDELERLQAQAASMGPAELTRTAEILNAGLTEMRGAASPRLLLELMCARILLPGAAQGETALLTRLERLERSGPATVPMAAAPTAHLVPAPATHPVPVLSVSSPVHGTGVHGAPTAASAAASPAVPAPPVVPTAHAAPQPPAGPAAASGAGAAPAGDDDWPTPARLGARTAPPQPPAPAGQTPSADSSPAASGPGGESPPGTAIALVRQAWPQVLATLKQRSMFVWATVNTNAQVVGVEGNIVTLGFTQPGAMKNFTGGGKEVVVAAVLQDVLGGTWKVEAVVGNGPAPSGGGRAPAVPARPPAPQHQAAPQGQAAAPQSPVAAPQRQPESAPTPARTAPPATDESWPDAPLPDDPGVPPSPSPGLAAARSAARAAAQTGPRAAVKIGAKAAWPDAVPGRGAVPDADEVDPLNDADADVDALTGMALIQRELGGQIIGEIDHT
ncbi:DNA polymerase-3 subunit gamma/tau [Streptosporangium becharense]|uniref:DNA polymerase III subunit gamma/tau n=1 Tax=Streptosporangium becharense TaxID=1816182 RepID=A0A7W9IGS8_9ACTN|nr:DNA polymerase III subunit gamma and tau [Streptosporangium becharense]MBB2912669.1 DNA polymerase-3 subunit gamma/tau [Streptosporangium becharense]MBB5820502.1 DNA polymerase-3 subunit gamma/tau [Streptosporangium becharense]